MYKFYRCCESMWRIQKQHIYFNMKSSDQVFIEV